MKGKSRNTAIECLRMRESCEVRVLWNWCEVRERAGIENGGR